VDASGKSVLRFEVFELDLKSQELRRSGLPVKLQPQPFKVLALLASRPNQVVTRDEIQQQIWDKDTFVDFQQGLNFCIKKIRTALADDSDKPRYIETLPRRGYRFIAPVEETGPRKVMLAVLPLENLSADPEQEYFSDGLTEEMIAQLGRLHPESLGVISRTSAMRYKGTDKGADEIGRELGVSYILEGTVRREASQVRITAQLIQVSDQTHLWAESYDRDVAAVFAVQSEVAQRIAHSLEVELLPAQVTRPASASSINPEAHEAYLKGRYNMNKRTPQGLQKGLRYFEQAVEKDPEYALAYAGVADTYILLGSTQYALLSPEEAMPRAKGAATKALEINDSLAEAHASLANVKLIYKWDWAGAEREFQRTLALHPGYSHAHHWYSLQLAATGRTEEGFSAIRRARRLDPLSPIINVTVGWHFYLARQYDRAVEDLRNTLEMEPRGSKYPVSTSCCPLRRQSACDCGTGTHLGIGGQEGRSAENPE
jgi:TolB-like protein/Flp pilus assembly protein TadD